MTEKLNIILQWLLCNITTLKEAISGKAAKTHGHSTNDIISGVLSVALGGTGQTSTVGIKSAFGVTDLENKIETFIQVVAVSADAISLAAGYDGYTYATAPAISGYRPILVTPRYAGASDVCWIDCYFNNTYSIVIKLKNTTTTPRNNFIATVSVLYVR